MVSDGVRDGAVQGQIDASVEDALQIAHGRIGQGGWYTRPIFSVSNMQNSLQHYCDVLGFEQSWKHDENGCTLVSQVNKGGFELILTETLQSLGQARVYVALEKAEYHELKKMIKEQQIPVQSIFWGYPLLRVNDPDGNEMLISTEEDTCHVG